MRILILIAILSGYLWTDNARADEPLIEWAPVLTLAADWTVDADLFLQPGCTEIPVRMHFTHPVHPEKDRTFRGHYDQCHGRDPWADGKLGVEFAHRNWRDHWYIPVFTLAWRHRSHWRDGGPWNDRPESYADYVTLEIRLGGLR